MNNARLSHLQQVQRIGIGNHLSYKPRNDLCIHKTAELESFRHLLN